MTPLHCQKKVLIMGSSIADSPTYAHPEAVKSQSAPANDKWSEARRRLPLNIFCNSIWLCINVFVGLWYTPFLIANLGVAVYGLVPLANSITYYLVLVTDGFDSAVSRFLQIDLARDDTQAANRTFNTAIAGGLTLFTIIIPIAIFMSWLTPRVFHVPAGYGHDAQGLVLLTMLAFAITFLSGSFAVPSFAFHRFDLRLFVNLIRLTVQMGSIVLLFTTMSPRLWFVGVGIFLSSIFAILGHGTIWHRLTPYLKIRFSLFDISRLKELLRFSGWVLVNQAGTQLFVNIDLIVANLVFGAYVAGRYGAVLIFPVFLRMMLGTLGSVMEPIVYTLYAKNDLTKLTRFCNLAVKFIGLTFALPIGLICGLAKPLLTLWLGPEFSTLSWLVIVLVGQLSINLVVFPLYPIQEAANRIRLPGIVTLATGVLNAGLAVSLALWSGWGFIGIAIAGAIVNSSRNTAFTPIYAARVLKLPWHTFLPRLVYGILGSATVGTLTYWAVSTRSLTNWGSLVLTVMIISIFYMIAVYFVGLNSDERSLIFSEIAQRLKR